MSKSSFPKWFKANGDFGLRVLIDGNNYRGREVPKYWDWSRRSPTLMKAERTGHSPNHAALGGLVTLGLGPAPFK